MAVDNTTKYRRSDSPCTGFSSKGGLKRYSLRLSNDDWHSWFYSKVFPSPNAWNIGLKHSEYLETNLFKAANQPVNFWTSLTLLGGFKSLTTQIWFGWASFPHFVTSYPRKFSEETPNEHFAWLGFILYFHKTLRVCWRCEIWSELCFDLTIISSIYTSIVRSIRLANTLLTKCW